jgi:hypothetical protein
MTIAEAVQADEVEVAAVMTMMMTIVVAVQADEVEVAAVMTTMIMMAAVKTRVIKNVMPTDVLRLKQNVLKTKEAFASFYLCIVRIYLSCYFKIRVFIVIDSSKSIPCLLLVLDKVYCYDKPTSCNNHT